MNDIVRKYIRNYFVIWSHDMYMYNQCSVVHVQSKTQEEMWYCDSIKIFIHKYKSIQEEIYTEVVIV